MTFNLLNLKVICLFGALLSVSPNADASSISDRLTDYCQGEGISICLRGVLALKCAAYHRSEPFSKSLRECESTASDMMTLLEIDPEPAKQGETNQLVFKTRLSRVMAEPGIEHYLTGVTEGAKQAIQSETRFKLWDYTLSAVQGNRFRALERIAVLFQDTDPNSIVFDYARIRGMKVSPRLKSIWQDAVDSVGIKRLQANKGEAIVFIRTYPAVDTEFLNAGFYHFYFTAYLTSRLQALGHDAQAAIFLPFLLNALYEFFELPRTSLLGDAKPFSEKRYHYKLTDLYGGYVGPLWWMSQTTGIKPFPVFSRELSANPSLTMHRLSQKFFESPASFNSLNPGVNP
ncbi:MAG: hypothetical protein H7301_00860 [Cryobacterium sp.]|nr:hypothetical protein [Oligoflexia bacterium]